MLLLVFLCPLVFIFISRPHLIPGIRGGVRKWNSNARNSQNFIWRARGACMSYLLINYRQTSIRLRGLRCGFYSRIKNAFDGDGQGEMGETGRFAKLLVKKWLRLLRFFFRSFTSKFDVHPESFFGFSSSLAHFQLFYVILIEKMRPIGRRVWNHARYPSKYKIS